MSEATKPQTPEEKKAAAEAASTKLEVLEPTKDGYQIVKRGPKKYLLNGKAFLWNDEQYTAEKLVSNLSLLAKFWTADNEDLFVPQH